MPFTSRRSFVRNAALGAGLAGAPAVYPSWGQNSPNNQINLGVVGFRGRGRDHYRAFAQIPGVRVAYLCDVDERLFPGAHAVEKHVPGGKNDKDGYDPLHMIILTFAILL